MMATRSSPQYTLTQGGTLFSATLQYYLTRNLLTGAHPRPSGLSRFFPIRTIRVKGMQHAFPVRQQPTVWVVQLSTNQSGQQKGPMHKNRNTAMLTTTPIVWGRATRLSQTTTDNTQSPLHTSPSQKKKATYYLHELLPSVSAHISCHEVPRDTSLLYTCDHRPPSVCLSLPVSWLGKHISR